MEKYDDKLYRLMDEIERFISDEVPNEEKVHVAHSLMSSIVFDSTENHLEAMGLIELFKIDYHEEFKDFHEGERLRDLGNKN